MSSATPRGTVTALLQALGVPVMFDEMKVCALVISAGVAITITAPAAAGVTAHANRIPQNPNHSIISETNISQPGFALSNITSSIGVAEASGSASAGHIALQAHVILGTSDVLQSGVFDGFAQGSQSDIFRASDTLCNALGCVPAIQLGVDYFELDFTISASGTVFAAADQFSTGQSSIGFGWTLSSASNSVLGGGYKQTNTLPPFIQGSGPSGEISSQSRTLFMRPGDDLSLLLTAEVNARAGISSPGFGQTSFASAGADFSHTLEWGGVTGLRAYGASGNLIQLAPGSRITLLDEAGNDFWFGAPSFAAGVPEPSAWALLIFGFGAVGAGMRVRRRDAPALA